MSNEGGNLKEDARGQKLAEQSAPRVSGNDLDQIENYANDPANATPPGGDEVQTDPETGAATSADGKGRTLPGRSGKPAAAPGEAPVSAGTAGGLTGAQDSKSQSASQSGLSKLGGAAGGGGAASLFQRIGAFSNRNKKGFSIGAAVMAIILATVIGIFTILPLKLIHFKEVVSDYFSQRQDHMNDRRIGKLWKVVANKDGTLMLKRSTGHPLSDRLHNTISKNIVESMKAKGLNVSLEAKPPHRITLDGKLMDGKLADRRSRIRTELKKAYPNDGYVRRAIRTGYVFRSFGIKRKFFENTREKGKVKLSEWKERLNKKIRGRLFGAEATSLSAKTGGTTEEDTKSNDAMKELNDELGEEAEKLRTKSLNDPKFKVPNIDVNLATDVLKKVGAGAAKSAINITSGLTAVCNVKNLMAEVRIAAEILRAASLARYAGTILVAADQVKDGHDVNIWELNALMQSLDEFEKSGFWQRITNPKSKAQVTTAAKYSLDLSDQGGKAGFFVKVSNMLDDIPGGGTTCKVATNIFFQIASTVVTVGLSLFTGGGISLVSVVANASASAALGAFEAILKPMAIQMLAGMTVTGDESGKDRGDAFVGGADIIFNQMARTNGARKLTGAEVAEQNITIARERAEDARSANPLTRMADLGNPMSLASRFVMATPSSPKQAIAKLAALTSFFNPFMFSQQFAANTSGFLDIVTPTALANDPDVNDPLGVEQNGLPDSVLDDPRYDDVEANEKRILDNPDMKKDYDDFVASCVNVSYIDSDSKAKCESTEQKYNDFRIYRLDLGLGGGIEYLSNPDVELPDDDNLGG